MHHAKRRLSVLDQRDVHGELAVALDELARAIQRIDQPEARPAASRVPGDFLAFLGKDRDVRRQRAQTIDDDAIGGEVGSGQRRIVALGLDVEIVAAVHGHDGVAGLMGDVDDGVAPIAHAVVPWISNFSRWAT